MIQKQGVVSYRVYSEDVDHMGIMYHANHLRFFERARTELLRAHGVSLTTLAEQGTHFAIHDVHLRYQMPALLDDLVTIDSEYKIARATTIQFKQLMKNQLGEILCTAEVLVVCLNNNYKPKRLPADWG